MWPYLLTGSLATVGVIGARAAALKAMDKLRYLPGAPAGTPRFAAGAREGRPAAMLLFSIGRSGFLAYRERGQYLAWKPYLSWNRMARAAKRDGIDLTSQLVNSFRTWLHQQRLASQEGAAPPGFSPHQRGYAVDVNTQGTDGAAAQAWLEQNAARFGWRRTYWARHHWEFG